MGPTVVCRATPIVRNSVYAFERAEVEVRHCRYMVLGLAVMLVCCAAWVAGCDRLKEFSERMQPSAESERAESRPPDGLGESVTFEVDGDGVFYVTYGADGKKHPAEQLNAIPIAERGAVGIHVSGQMPDEMVGEKTYVSDLFGAVAGETGEATLQAFEAFQVRSRESTRGGERAAEIVSHARELVGADDAVETADGSRLVRKREATPEPEKRERPAPSEPAVNSGEVVIRSADQLRAHAGDVELKAPGGEAAGESSGEPEPGGAAGEPEANAYRSVILYGAEWCGNCVQAKDWMEANGVDFTWRDIQHSRKAKREMIQFCRRKGVKPGSIPTIRIEGGGNEGDRVMQGWAPGPFQKLAAR